MLVQEEEDEEEKRSVQPQATLPDASHTQIMALVG